MVPQASDVKKVLLTVLLRAQWTFRLADPLVEFIESQRKQPNRGNAPPTTGK